MTNPIIFTRTRYMGVEAWGPQWATWPRHRPVRGWCAGPPASPPARRRSCSARPPAAARSASPCARRVAASVGGRYALPRRRRRGRGLQAAPSRRHCRRRRRLLTRPQCLKHGDPIHAQKRLTAAAAAAPVGPSRVLAGRRQREVVQDLERRQRGPIDAPCTQYLRHGDSMHARKGLTAAAPASPSPR
jgi:hypothetical protein